MLRFLTVLAALAFAAPAFADDKDKPKPNALTPEEIAEGWVMLFDGETTFGWKFNGAAEVKDGALVIGKGQKTTAVLTSRFGSAFEYELEVYGAGKIVGPRGSTQIDSATAQNPAV